MFGTPVWDLGVPARQFGGPEAQRHRPEVLPSATNTGGRSVNHETGVLSVKIEYEQKIKNLKFHKRQYHYRDRLKYKSVTLDMTKGQFGFEIIKKQELDH